MNKLSSVVVKNLNLQFESLTKFAHIILKLSGIFFLC